jgi:hypothetical protein
MAQQVDKGFLRLKWLDLQTWSSCEDIDTSEQNRCLRKAINHTISSFVVARIDARQCLWILSQGGNHLGPELEAREGGKHHGTALVVKGKSNNVIRQDAVPTWVKRRRCSGLAPPRIAQKSDRNTT